MNAGSSHPGFRLADVILLEEYRAGEIVDLDGIEIKDIDVANAEQGQVFQQLVADGAGADSALPKNVLRALILNVLDLSTGFHDGCLNPPVGGSGRKSDYSRHNGTLRFDCCVQADGPEGRSFLSHFPPPPPLWRRSEDWRRDSK